MTDQSWIPPLVMAGPLLRLGAVGLRSSHALLHGKACGALLEGVVVELQPRHWTMVVIWVGEHSPFKYGIRMLSMPRVLIEWRMSCGESPIMLQIMVTAISWWRFAIELQLLSCFIYHLPASYPRNMFINLGYLSAGLHREKHHFRTAEHTAAQGMEVS